MKYIKIDLDERLRIERIYRQESKIEKGNFISLEKFLPLSYILDNTFDRFFHYKITDQKKWIFSKIKYGISAIEYEDLQCR